MENGISLDIAPAYGSEAGVLRCERELRLDKALTLHDCIELAQEKPVEWVFMLRHEPRMDGGVVRSGRIRIAWSGCLEARIEEIPVTDARMVKNYPGSIWRLTLGSQPGMRYDELFTIERN